MPTPPRRSRHTVLEPYRLTMAYTMATLRERKGDCPRTIVVWAKDAEDAILVARNVVPHVHGFSSVRPSTSSQAVAL